MLLHLHLLFMCLVRTNLVVKKIFVFDINNLNSSSNYRECLIGSTSWCFLKRLFFRRCWPVHQLRIARLRLCEIPFCASFSKTCLHRLHTAIRCVALRFTWFICYTSEFIHGFLFPEELLISKFISIDTFKNCIRNTTSSSRQLSMRAS